MTINHAMSQNRTVIELEGELGHHEAIQAMERIGEIIDVHLPKNVVLDLSGLTFMDSSGIAVIMQSHRRCSAIGSDFELSGTPKQAMRVLTAAGVDKVVKLK